MFMNSEQPRAVKVYVGDIPEWWAAIKSRIEEYEKLAAIGYLPKKIAMYFGVSPFEFLDFFNKPYSPAKYHYDRGKLMQEAKEGMTMAADAASGKNAAQAMRWDKHKKAIGIASAIEEICFSYLIFD